LIAWPPPSTSQHFFVPESTSFSTDARCVLAGGQHHHHRQFAAAVAVPPSRCRRGARNRPWHSRASSHVDLRVVVALDGRLRVFFGSELVLPLPLEVDGVVSTIVVFSVHLPLQQQFLDALAVPDLRPSGGCGRARRRGLPSKSPPGSQRPNRSFCVAATPDATGSPSGPKAVLDPQFVILPRLAP